MKCPICSSGTGAWPTRAARGRLTAGKFPAASHELALDFARMVDQQQQDEIDRALRLPVSDPIAAVELAGVAARAGRLLGFKSDGSLDYVPGVDSSSDLVTASGGTVGRSLSERFGDVVNVLDHGVKADGDGAGLGTDNAAALQMLIDVIEAAGVRRQIYFPPGWYLFSETIEIDVYLVSLIADRAGLDFTLLTGVDNAIELSGSQAAPTLFEQWLTALSGFCVLGPGKTSTVDGIVTLDPDAAAQGVNRIRFENIRIDGFQYDFLCGPSTYMLDFIHCNFRGAAQGFRFPDVANAGEAIDFIGCLFDSNDLDIWLDNDNTQLNLFGCRLDTTVNRVIEIGDKFGSTVNVFGGNIERPGGLWAQSPFKVTGRPRLNLHGVHIQQGSTSDGPDPYFEHAGSTVGGIFLDGCFLNNLNNASDRLGSGRVELKNMQFAGAVVEHPRIVSPDMNLLLDGGFELADFEDDWSVNGATTDYKTNASLTIAVQGATFRSGAQALRASPTADSTRFSLMVPVKPNDLVWYELYYQWSAAPTSAFLTAYWVRAKADPGVADGRAWIVTHRENFPGGIEQANILATAWTRVATNNNADIHRAPGWATHFELRFALDTGTSGKNLFVDDALVNIVSGG